MMSNSPYMLVEFQQEFQNRAKAEDHKTQDEHLPKKMSYSRLSWLERLNPFIIIVPVIVAAAVFILNLSSYRNTRRLVLWVESSRALVQVLIFIISNILGFFWTFAVCATIDRHIRSLFLRRYVRLVKLRLYSALSQGKVNWHLPPGLCIIALVFAGIAALPATLWSGAITPQIATKDVSEIPFLVPLTGNRSFSFVRPRNDTLGPFGDCRSLNVGSATLTNCPGPLTRSLLLSASTATTIDGSRRNHTKLTNEKWHYNGRSYGVGSAVGLADNTAVLKNLNLTHSFPSISSEPSTALGYSYLESGYEVVTQCIYNDSSMWYLELEYNLGYAIYPNIFNARGFFPNSNWTEIARNVTNMGFNSAEDHFAQVAFGMDAIAVIGSTNSDKLKEYYIAIAAGPRGEYSFLNKIQCQLYFKPTNFQVQVFNQNFTVRVAPLGPTQDPEPRGLLRSKVMNSLNIIGMIETSLYASTVGEALADNIENMSQRKYGTPDRRDNATILAAVEDAITAIADDILVAYGSLALAYDGNTMEINGTMTVQAVQIGSTTFICVVFALNLIGLCFVIGASIFTRCWADATVFDYNDVSSVAVGATLGEKGTLEGPSSLEAWNGAPTSAIFKSTSAKLTIRNNVPSILFKKPHTG